MSPPSAMDSDMVQSPPRPQHRRSESSKPSILRAFVMPKAPAVSTASPTSPQRNDRTYRVPLAPADHSYSPRSKPLGERQSNAQSPSSSPSKPRPRCITTSKSSHDTSKRTQDGPSGPKKAKSSTNLGAMFAKMNRSSKDVSQPAKVRDKENTTPPTTATGAVPTPIWAQFASTAEPKYRPGTRESNVSDSVRADIALYTPRDYSPSKQRNFHVTPALAALKTSPIKGPQSSTEGEATVTPARRPSGEFAGFLRRSSGESGTWKSVDNDGLSIDEKSSASGRDSLQRRVSGSSAEPVSAKESLVVAKRGGRVLAAVAAFQGTAVEVIPKTEPTLDAETVNQAFEAVLESRNIPEPMRQKMRSLTLRVKADFVKQDKAITTPATNNSPSSNVSSDVRTGTKPTTDATEEDQDSKSTKRSRTRSRTFTFSKGDKRSVVEILPSKKARSQSRGRATNAPDNDEPRPPTPTTPRRSLGRTARTQTVPGDFIAYLRKQASPAEVEVGRLHKLRILLRNETVAWVDAFISLGGMAEIVALLHRIMDVEWREEHEDQLLHETLLCLKGLCTTERAMAELEKVADQLFPALLGMLYGEEKKGPAEYSTRTIIITVLFSFLESATRGSPVVLEQRARKILGYLSEPSKPDDDQPVEFVLDMQMSRPYKMWCREVTNVTKEVFWIFLHHLNVVPLPKNESEEASESITSPAPASPADEAAAAAERAKVLEATYTQRHFPGTRPPVPAAPYIGGVEWDATSYVTAHLDLLNGAVAAERTAQARNTIRAALRDSGFERLLGATLRTCKEKFYAGVHDALRAWVAAAAEDGWDTRLVREGPSLEDQAARARSASPRKLAAKKDPPPQLDAPVLDMPRLDLGLNAAGGDGDDDGWLG